MPPSSERSSGSPSQLLSAPGLRVVALVLFVMFATLVAGALWKVQLLNPIWQLRLAGSLVNGAPFALLGLALLQIAEELGPHDPLLKSRQRLCSQLAVIKVPPREPGDHELCQSRYRHCREAPSGGGDYVKSISNFKK